MKLKTWLSESRFPTDSPLPTMAVNITVQLKACQQQRVLFIYRLITLYHVYDADRIRTCEGFLSP